MESIFTQENEHLSLNLGWRQPAFEQLGPERQGYSVLEYSILKNAHSGCDKLFIS